MHGELRARTIDNTNFLVPAEEGGSHLYQMIGMLQLPARPTSDTHKDIVNGQKEQTQLSCIFDETLRVGVRKTSQEAAHGRHTVHNV